MVTRILDEGQGFGGSWVYATLEAYAADLAKSFGAETASLTRGPS